MGTEVVLGGHRRNFRRRLHQLLPMLPALVQSALHGVFNELLAYSLKDAPAFLAMTQGNQEGICTGAVPSENFKYVHY